MEAPLPEERSQHHPRGTHITGLLYEYVLSSELFYKLKYCLVLKVPRYEGDNIPGTGFVHPAEGVDEEQNVLAAELLYRLTN